MLVIGTLAFIAHTIRAQEETSSDTSASNASPLTPGEIAVLQSGSTAGPNAPPPAVPGGTLTQTPRRFQYSLSFTERTVYDDNIGISSFNRKSDLYFAFEPSLSLGWGETDSVNSLAFVYHPSGFLFLDHSQDDGVQHLVRLQVGHNFGHLSLVLSQDVQILNGADLNSLADQTGHNANIDVGARTKHNIYTTNLNASYDLTGKLFLSSAANMAIDDYPRGQQIGSKNFSGNLFLNYQYREKIVFGLGGTGGYNKVDSGSPDQLFEQANARVSYTATAKINLSAMGGLEFREFANHSRGAYLSPVFTIAAAYQPFDGTSISLAGSRNTNNSAALSGQDYSETLISASIRQRFLTRTTLGLSGGFANSDYFSTINGLPSSRVDDYYFVEPSVDVTITRFLSAGAYYLHRQDRSSLNFFSFYDNQFGFKAVLSF